MTGWREVGAVEPGDLRRRSGPACIYEKRPTGRRLAGCPPATCRCGQPHLAPPTQPPGWAGGLEPDVIGWSQLSPPERARPGVATCIDGAIPGHRPGSDGVSALALVRLAVAEATTFGGSAPAVATGSLLLASALFGFGIWWLGATAMVRYLAQGPLPYGLGWWAFTFPVGAFSMATLTLGSAWRLGAVTDLGVGLVALMLVLWLVVTGRTLWATATGDVWKPASRTGSAGVTRAVPAP